MDVREKYIKVFENHGWEVTRSETTGENIIYVIKSPAVYSKPQFGIQAYADQVEQTIELSAGATDSEVRDALLSCIRPISNKWGMAVSEELNRADKTAWPDYYHQNCTQMISSGQQWLIKEGNVLRGECAKIDTGAA